MLDALTHTNPVMARKMGHLKDAIDHVGNLLKQDGGVLVKHPIELLDALADQIVTATGVGTFLGMDVPGATKEVNRSNYSKFENGEPIFNENKKVMKGKDYTPPDLSKFI